MLETGGGRWRSALSPTIINLYSNVPTHSSKDLLTESNTKINSHSRYQLNGRTSGHASCSTPHWHPGLTSTFSARASILWNSGPARVVENDRLAVARLRRMGLAAVRRRKSGGGSGRLLWRTAVVTLWREVARSGWCSSHGRSLALLAIYNCVSIYAGATYDVESDDGYRVSILTLTTASVCWAVPCMCTRPTPLSRQAVSSRRFL